MTANLAHPSIPLSSCIQSAADNILLLVEAEKAPLLYALEQQRRRLVYLEQQNSELRQLLAQARGSKKNHRNEDGLDRVTTTTRELDQLKAISKGVIDIDQPATAQADEDIATQLRAAKEEIVQIKDRVQKHVDALDSALARENAAVLKEKQVMQVNYANEIEQYRQDLQVAAMERELASRLTTVLEENGIGYSLDVTGCVNFRYSQDLDRVMREVVAEAKRRHLVPSTMDLSSLEAGKLTLPIFATLVNYIIRRAKANEQQIGSALNEAKDKGWTIAQFIEYVTVTGQPSQQIPVQTSTN